MSDEEQPQKKTALARFRKTPYFTAGSALRYHRQALINEIETLSGGRKLLCYVCGNDIEIKRDDVAGFVDLLHNIHEGDRIDLVLHTGGGDIDATEKLMRLIEEKIGNKGDIRAIVPDYAKSAGTLMALGAHSVLMSNTSELGAIDPQFVLGDVLGNQVRHSVLQYLAGFEQAEASLRKFPNDPVARMMFDKYDPAIVNKLRLTVERVRNVAENLLKRRGMPFSAISEALLDIARWKSHTQEITAHEAIGIGLNVELIDQDDPLWEKIWQLHCLQRLETSNKQTLFESYYVSLLIGDER